ncbi:hypothetical protein EDC01DRAFT_232408 [Geopyxis carbonaria]|nr:hypothetical protein EDC01DRAFT_232408 [Geopyxis carbonaria]
MLTELLLPALRLHSHRPWTLPFQSSLLSLGTIENPLPSFQTGQDTLSPSLFLACARTQKSPANSARHLQLGAARIIDARAVAGSLPAMFLPTTLSRWRNTPMDRVESTERRDKGNPHATRICKQDSRPTTTTTPASEPAAQLATRRDAAARRQTQLANHGPMERKKMSCLQGGQNQKRPQGQDGPDFHPSVQTNQSPAAVL